MLFSPLVLSWRCRAYMRRPEKATSPAAVVLLLGFFFRWLLGSLSRLSGQGGKEHIA